MTFLCILCTKPIVKGEPIIRSVGKKDQEVRYSARLDSPGLHYHKACHREFVKEEKQQLELF